VKECKAPEIRQISNAQHPCKCRCVMKILRVEPVSPR
jgi:hypothetical protein